ncbi:tyrosine-type recombinase/integrase [Paraburkholderia bannensis]|uniref:tyrosine-type recombinase/integrase n=1 Tax=Paraburkholderia bannensis TaxID=765414 RepID=UPI002AB058CE|nr:tyrosine-type recombinase/integrase [Paraburkholderia bannensis]
MEAQILRHLQAPSNRTKTNGELARDFDEIATYKSFQKVLKNEGFQKRLADTCDFHVGMTGVERKLYLASRTLAEETGSNECTTSSVLKRAGVSHSAVTRLLSPSENLSSQLQKAGIRICRVLRAQHDEVNFIKDTIERRQYLRSAQIIDVRHLYAEFPENYTPNEYCVSVASLPDSLRNELCDFMELTIPEIAPQSLSVLLRMTVGFLEGIFALFPACDIYQLDRREHILPYKSTFAGSKKTLTTRLLAGRRFLNRAVFRRPRDDQRLITNRDLRYKDPIAANPICSTALGSFDQFLEKTIILNLEGGSDTPLTSPDIWDAIVVLRFTGARVSDVARLRTSPEPDMDCLRLDGDGDPQLFIRASDTKNRTDHTVPLTFLNNIFRDNSNPVVDALTRQKHRVTSLPPCVHADDYLFRRHTEGTSSTLLNPRIVNRVLRDISAHLDLRDDQGEPYSFSASQFRDTVACEMINNGVDIYAVQRFLGHLDISKTQRYVEVLCSVIKEQLSNACSNGAYKARWNKDGSPNSFEQSDGCCDHPYKIGDCPAKSCRTCSRKKSYSRHLPVLEANIVAYQACAERAALAGDSDAESRYKEVVRYSTIAVDAIRKKGFFDARADYVPRRRGRP